MRWKGFRRMNLQAVILTALLEYMTSDYQPITMSFKNFETLSTIRQCTHCLSAAIASWLDRVAIVLSGYLTVDKPLAPTRVLDTRPEAVQYIHW